MKEEVATPSRKLEAAVNWSAAKVRNLEKRLELGTVVPAESKVAEVPQVISLEALVEAPKLGLESFFEKVVSEVGALSLSRSGLADDFRALKHDLASVELQLSSVAEVVKIALETSELPQVTSVDAAEVVEVTELAPRVEVPSVKKSRRQKQKVSFSFSSPKQVPKTEVQIVELVKHVVEPEASSSKQAVELTTQAPRVQYQPAQQPVDKAVGEAEKPLRGSKPPRGKEMTAVVQQENPVEVPQALTVETRSQILVPNCEKVEELESVGNAASFVSEVSAHDAKQRVHEAGDGSLHSHDQFLDQLQDGAEVLTDDKQGFLREALGGGSEGFEEENLLVVVETVSENTPDDADLKQALGVYLEAWQGYKDSGEAAQGAFDYILDSWGYEVQSYDAFDDFVHELHESLDELRDWDDPAEKILITLDEFEARMKTWCSSCFRRRSYKLLHCMEASLVKVFLT